MASEDRLDEWRDAVNPVDVLSEEHALIQRYLELLAQAEERIKRETPVPMSFFELGWRFAREFVDEYHHFKEEDVMFALLDKKRTGDASASLATLRAQHERGRAIVSDMAHLVHGHWLEESVRMARLAENLSAYRSLLREHILLEDDVIFPLARKAFTPEEANVLLAQYQAERLRFGNPFQHYQTLLSEMSALLG